MPLGEQLAPHFARLVRRSGAAPARAAAATLDAAPAALRASTTLRRQLAELRRPQRRGRRRGRARQRQRRGARLGRLERRPVRRGGGRRRARAAPARLDAEALRLRAGVRAAADHAGDAARRFAGADRHRRAACTCRRTTTAQFKGCVSARTALGASLNVPAVRVGAMLGADALLARLQRARPRAAGKRRLLRRVARARQRRRHAARADQRLPRARQRRPVTRRSVLRRRRARRRGRCASPIRRRSFLVTDILADNNARARTFGLDSALATRGFAAVKTGTSKDMRDNWCVGFTDRYTVGVWVGNASGEAMHDVSGVSGAAPVWQALARHLHAGAPSRAAGARRPASSRLRVAFDSAQRAGARRGLPRRQRARAAARHAPRSRGARASASPARATAACSRSIPTSRRRRSASPSKASTARGCSTASALGSGRAAALGAVAGAARARRCVGADGQALQSVSFEVRGAGVKPPAAPKAATAARVEGKGRAGASRKPQP